MSKHKSGSSITHDQVQETEVAWNDIGSVVNYLAMGLSRTEPRTGWRFGSIEQLVLEYGQHFTPQSLPPGIRQGAMKECYQNALDLSVRRRELTYCEGFASSFLVTMHAWCVDESGNVVDPTWTERLAGREYFGIPLCTRWLAGVMLKKTETGILYDREQGYPLLQHGIPQEALHLMHRPEHPDVAETVERFREALGWMRQQSE